MVRIGYTMMTEQAGPRELVEHVVRAEEAGFDFSVTSDHYFPWLEEQGHSPYAWSVLGAAAQATSRIPLMTYVTCPTKRYHPAVVAQKAATMQLLSGGRFRLGLGSGENLNEHVVGGGWPPVDVRHEMFEEAVEIIRALFEGGHVNYRGEHFDVESAKLWDLPDQPPPIGIAVSGKRSCALAGHHADLLIATEPKPELLEMFDEHGGQGKPRVGQLPVCYDPDRNAAVERAHAQFRWFGNGWKVNAELPTRTPSRRRPSSYGPTTSPRPSPAATTRTTSSRRSARTRRPGSRRSPWCRSAASRSRRIWTGRRRRCCRRCGRRSADPPCVRCDGFTREAEHLAGIRGTRGLYVGTSRRHLVNSFVHKTLVVELQAGDTERFPVLAHLSYDPSDPFAVTVVFTLDGRVLARWQLDREMVTEGLSRPVGIGDVRLNPQAAVWDGSCGWSSWARREPTAAGTTRWCSPGRRPSGSS